MTQPTAPFDFDRVLTNATQAAAGAVAPLAAELAMTREMSEQRAARVAELEQSLADRDAELGRLRQTNEMLQEQMAQVEAVMAADREPAEGDAVNS